jgi:predicted nucleic acid-binding Zn ribbon protein
MSTRQEDDDLDETEGPDEFDRGSDDGPSVTIPCPNCGQDVYEDAERCPHCAEYITAAASPGRPTWLIIAAVLALLGVLFWLAL